MAKDQKSCNIAEFWLYFEAHSASGGLGVYWIPKINGDSRMLPDFCFLRKYTILKNSNQNNQMLLNIFNMINLQVFS